MSIFPFLIVFALIAVVISLLVGLAVFAKGGPDRHRSNRLMQWRVVLQGVAIFVVLLAVILAKGN